MLKWLRRRRPPTAPVGPSIQRREQQAARQRLLALARTRQAEYRYRPTP